MVSVYLVPKVFQSSPSRGLDPTILSSEQPVFKGTRIQLDIALVGE